MNEDIDVNTAGVRKVGSDASRRKRRFPPIAIILTCAAVLIVAILLWSTQIVKIVTTLNPHDVLFVIATGIISGVIVTVVSSTIQKDAWTDDLTELNVKFVNLATRADQLNGELAILRQSYVSHLNGLVDAIGGPFTKSLFAYPPIASDGIAAILSDESGRLYKQHHQRVLVTTGTDTYVIDGIGRFPESDVTVWSLRFHTTWTWFNDSKVPKRPLDDLTFVTVANDEALNSFTNSLGSAERAQQRNRREDFFEARKNVVRATAVNPLNITERLSQEQIKSVFNIERITVSYGKDLEELERFDSAELQSVSGELPDGIYSAFVLPTSRELPSLKEQETMRLDYIGHFYLVAGKIDASYSGWLTFTPSDIVAHEYRLTILYPPMLQSDGHMIDLVIDPDRTGCEYIHEPVDIELILKKNATANDIPAEFRGFCGSSATMIVPERLTSLHRLSAAWNGVLNGSVRTESNILAADA